ncbi:MAG TPA: type II secretion system protein [Actinomycetes bacterium]
MTAALLAGGAVGLGLYLLVRALAPSRPGLGARLALIDAARAEQWQPAGRLRTQPSGSRLRGRLGDRMAAFYATRGWQHGSLRADVNLLGRSWEGFLATKAIAAAAVVALAPFVTVALAAAGVQLGAAVPLWLALLLGAVAFFLPDLSVRQEAALRRRDFRHVVGAYLDLVSMGLAGGKGVPEALVAAAEIGEGWALRRLRDCLLNARITGITQWAALGRLGEELAVDELRDLGAALELVADDGAKIRASLAARAATLRSRELAEIEGKAGERSQSMLVAQLLLCAGFMVFLAYPAVVRVFQA